MFRSYIRKAAYSNASSSVFLKTKNAAEVELKRELLIDEGEGIKSLPPLVPTGWRTIHESGTRFVIIKKLHGCASPAPPFFQYGNDSNLKSPQNSEFPLSSQLEVEIVAPYSTRDPSYFNNTIDLCEWTPFDVFCRRENKDNLLLLRLAAANSELRIRYVQWLTGAVAETIRAGARKKDIFLGFGPEADYYKTLAYHGPAMEDTSDELKACIMDFVRHIIGIDGHMLEYIQQAAYFFEHEDYQKWLMDLAVFASEAKKSKDSEVNLCDND